MLPPSCGRLPWFLKAASGVAEDARRHGGARCEQARRLADAVRIRCLHEVCSVGKGCGATAPSRSAINPDGTARPNRTCRLLACSPGSPRHAGHALNADALDLVRRQTDHQATGQPDADARSQARRCRLFRVGLGDGSAQQRLRQVVAPQLVQGAGPQEGGTGVLQAGLRQHPRQHRVGAVERGQRVVRTPVLDHRVGHQQVGTQAQRRVVGRQRQRGRCALLGIAQPAHGGQRFAHQQQALGTLSRRRAVGLLGGQLPGREVHRRLGRAHVQQDLRPHAIQLGLQVGLAGKAGLDQAGAALQQQLCRQRPQFGVGRIAAFIDLEDLDHEGLDDAGPGCRAVPGRARAIDVRLDRDRRAGHLLGAGVVRRQHAPLLLRQPHIVVGRAIVQQLGDAEVEQVGLALTCHQHVGRLQVAVHHQAAVRISHRPCHLHEQPELRPHAQPLDPAPGIDGLAVDVSQSQTWPAAVVHPGVVQPRDVRMLEQGVDVALARHAPGQPRPPRQAWQLQRHLPLEATVGALGQPHRAHAAAAELADEPVGADEITPVRHRLVGCQPAPGPDTGPLKGADQRFSSVPSSSLALSQSRRTVRSVISGARPISASV